MKRIQARRKRIAPNLLEYATQPFWRSICACRRDGHYIVQHPSLDCAVVGVVGDKVVAAGLQVGEGLGRSPLSLQEGKNPVRIRQAAQVAVGKGAEFLTKVWKGKEGWVVFVGSPLHPSPQRHVLPLLYVLYIDVCVGIYIHIMKE